MSLYRRFLVISSFLSASVALAASRSAQPPPRAPAGPPPRPAAEAFSLSEAPRLRTQLEGWLESLGAMERRFKAAVTAPAPLKR